ncbi:MAG: ArsA family ATPase [Acidobacteria bacterium]|jgi:arsenite/tail-anchored protein-transporting ATPase|nr:ArsA family ATPase [Acidobacteriota bacterium]
MRRATHLFFLGKGGVGKSTSSALASLALAEEGLDVLLVSLDPAHNQADIFETPLSDKPRSVTPHLKAIEIDQERWIKRYLKGVHDEINRNYRYLTSFNLDKYFKVMRHSPGLEEYALILAFQEIRRKYPDNDVMVFDMAPTALSLKFFNLPTLSLIWVRHLLALRRDIIEKRELITRVQLLNKEIETDKIVRRIGRSIEEYTELKELFENPDLTWINLVLNPDQLSLAESRRIVDELAAIDIGLCQILVNKTRTSSDTEGIVREFQGAPLATVPQSSTPLIGLDALRSFLAAGGFPSPDAEKLRRQSRRL